MEDNMFYSKEVYRQEIFFDTYAYNQDKHRYQHKGTISFNLANIVSIRTDENKAIITPDGDDLLKVEIITNVPEANFKGIVDRNDYEFYYYLFHKKED